ncbi:acidic leucine-rich nuclear phosphoprotein 32 family member A, partial [Tanacetum coccineum]
MTIDKSWTTISNRNSEEFLDGLFAFIKHCKPLLHPITQKIHCPCSRCCNRDDNRVTLEILEVHKSRYGFDQHYTTWKYHGEPILPLPPQVPHSPEHVDMDTFFEDISANNVPTPPTQTTGPQPFQTTGPNNEFEELLSRSTKKLYPGCDMSTLEFTTEISHIKALHKITDAGFNKILALLQKACPPSKGYNFPSSYYEIKKTYKKIGLGYESIHACINDCFLFWGSEENLKMPNCPVCKESRYKKKTKAGKLVAKKIVRYFPLTPRLQRMFNTKHIAKWMTWHATGQSKEKGKMNHPCDGRAWKYSESTEVDAPPVNDDNANANEGNAEDDDVAHVLDDDDDVVVSDDDEVNPSTNVEEMACVFPRSHGGDAGGSPPRRPNRPVPAQCESSNLRIETGNASLRRAFRQNGQRPLTIGFDYGDLGTFHPTGDYSSMLNSLMGETVKYLPLACEWEEIPEAYKAHIFPTLESYFDLASWYNNQDKVVMGNNVYTVGDRVKLGLQLKLRILWRKNKQRIKADHFTRYGSAEEARNHLPPKKVWGDRTEDEWNNLVDWWSHPDRVARSLQNAANRAKNTILTHQGKKSFAQGRNEYKVQKGHYEDLIETWRKTHSRPETGEFKTQKNLKRYLDMKSMQDQVRAGVIPYKTDQDILDEVVPSTNRQNMSGKGRKLPGGGSTSRRRGPQAFPDVISREEMDRILRQRDQEAELLRKQTAEAQQRAYLAALKADAAYQNSETMYGAIGEYFSNYAPNPTRPFMPPAFARPTMPQLSPEWAHLLNPPFPYNQPLQPSYAGPSQYTGPPGYTGPPRYTAPLQPLQPPYVGQFPFTPVNNNTFNNCYNPVMNSNLASTSNSRPELPRFIINPHNNDTRSVDELARDRELAGEDNDVGDNEEADSQQSSGDYSEDEEGDNEEVQDESEESN